MKHLLCTTLLMVAFVGNNSISFEQAIAEAGLVPAPSLQREATEILTTTESEITGSPIAEELSAIPTTNLPPQIQSAVLEVAAKRTSKPVATLSIVEAQPKNWSDGCLGLAEPDELCTQVITPGWRVVVTDGVKNWTYRTNDIGNLIKLEK